MADLLYKVVFLIGAMVLCIAFALIACEVAFAFWRIIVKGEER